MLLRFALGEEDREKIVFPLIDRQLHPGYCSTGDHRKSTLAHRPACALSGNSILPTPALSLSLGGVEAVKVLAFPRWVLVSGAWDQSIYGSVGAPWGW